MIDMITSVIMKQLPYKTTIYLKYTVGAILGTGQVILMLKSGNLIED